MSGRFLTNGSIIDLDSTYIAQFNGKKYSVNDNTITPQYFNKSVSSNFFYTIAGTGVAGDNGTGFLATNSQLKDPSSVITDSVGNIFITDETNERISFIPKVDGLYFGQSMTANFIYNITSQQDPNEYLTIRPKTACVDSQGNLYIADAGRYVIRFMPKVSGTYFGKTMTENIVYILSGTRGPPNDSNPITDGASLRNSPSHGPTGICVDYQGNIIFSDKNAHVIRFIPKVSGLYFGKNMMENCVYTIAGRVGIIGTGILGPAVPTNTELQYPYGVCVDSVGNVYIADMDNDVVKFISRVPGMYYGISMGENKMYVIAGRPRQSGTEQGVGSRDSASLKKPRGVAVDLVGNVYIADTDNQRIMFIPTSGGLHFKKNMKANFIYSIYGQQRSVDIQSGDGTRSGVNTPSDVGVDSVGNVYIADTYNYRIVFVPSEFLRGGKTTTNNIYTIAGTVSSSSDRELNSPSGATVDSMGNVYIADANNHRIGFVTKHGGTYFGIAMTANKIHTIAGTGSPGDSSDALARSSGLNSPSAVTLDSVENVYIADTSNNKIKFIPKVDGVYFEKNMRANYIYTIAGTGILDESGYNNVALATLATNSKLNSPAGVAVDSFGNVYIADTGIHKIKFIPKVSGPYFGQYFNAYCLYTIAGTGFSLEISRVVQGALLGPSTMLKNPRGLSIDLLENVYIADTGNNRIMFIPKVDGEYFPIVLFKKYYRINTIAGGDGGGGADEILATSPVLNSPCDVVTDSSQNIYIADTSNNKIKFIPKVNGSYFGKNMTAKFIYTIAGNGSVGRGSNDNGELATNSPLNSPAGVAVDSAGNVYIADTGNHAIKFIPKVNGTYFVKNMTANYIYKIAGRVGEAGGGTEGMPAEYRYLRFPKSVAVDSGGNVYIADSANHGIRFMPRVTGDYFGRRMKTNNDMPTMYTIAGQGQDYQQGNAEDNIEAISSKLNSPGYVALDFEGNVYISDTGNHVIRFIPKSSGYHFGNSRNGNYIYTIAGIPGSSGAPTFGVLATNSKLNNPQSVYIDSLRNVYISDTNNKMISFMPSSNGQYSETNVTENFIYRLTNVGETGACNGVSVDSFGNVYIADSENHKIRVVSLDSTDTTISNDTMKANYIYTIAGTGTVENNVSTANSKLNAPRNVSLDSFGNIYIADSENHRIRFLPKVSGSYFGRFMTANYIYTIAGTGSSGAGINGTPLNSALTTPNSVTVDNSGNVYITDTGNHRIRFISVSRSRNLLYYNKEYFNKNSGYYINNVDCFLNNSTVYEKL